MTSVSVALCTHNGARFIREQVRSICGQELPVSEVVLSDDASSDGCVAIAQKTFEECQRERPHLDIRLRVLLNERALGVTRNFQQAILACQGDLIALSDQDDIWHPGRLVRMVSEFEKHPDLLLLHTDARLVDEGGRDLHQSLFQSLGVKASEIETIHSGRALNVLLRRNLVAGATTVFRKSLLQRAAPFPIEWLHDEWLAIYAALIGRVDVLEDALIDYRQHGANQVGAFRPSVFADFQRVFAYRGETYVKRVAKAEVLLRRALSDEQATCSESVEWIRDKLAHERFRAGLPASRLLRVWPVIREVFSGRYDRYGIGKYNIFRDLFERV